MAKNIYVGNLVWDATQDDLYNLFQEHGKVTRAQVIMDRETGRSRGFGFVEMENDSEADRAVTALNGADFRGRPLTVNEAKPRDERGGGGGGGGGRGFGGGRGGGGGGGNRGFSGGTDRGRRY
jgi:RNA recognition motif-containing protein